MSDQFCREYAQLLTNTVADFDWQPVLALAEALWDAWENNQRVFICGNGGSAANAVHLANDLLYGIDPERGQGIKVMALTANTAVMTCLANDTDYAEIFSRQLTTQAEKGDLLLVFSGSGNSPNVVHALKTAATIGMRSFAVLGFSGGQCLDLADCPIHFPVHDMQISEDLQMVVGHMAMKSLRARRIAASSSE